MAGDRHIGGAEDREAAWPEQLGVRIAWCYYVQGLTQQEVAGRLGITRVRVNRLLAEARRRGVVRITIASPLAENVEIEERLKSRFGLRAARVVLAPEGGGDGALAELLGQVGAEALAPRLRGGWAVGVGWGVTLKAFAQAMPERPLGGGACVVAMLGSLTRRSSIDAFEATTALAQRLGAECFYMPGPLICDSEEGRETLLAQPMVRDIQARARAVDLAVVSVGGLEDGTVRQVGLIDDADLDGVRRAGAVGNFLGHYIDAQARVIDHPVNRRVLGLRPQDLLAIPRRAMISGGPGKLAALRAILRAGLLTEIVTDQASALALLDTEEGHGP